MSTANNIPNMGVNRHKKLQNQSSVPMIQISPNIYREVASILHKEIGKKHYYAGRIEGNADTFRWQLICAVVVHRSSPHNPVSETIPVWWEFNTYDEDGNQVLNDFQFSTLRPKVLKAVA